MKKYTMFLIILITVGCTLCHAEDRRTDKNWLSVMTLNAEFMWDGVEPEEGQVNFAWKHSQTEAEEHMADIADVIIEQNPDIVNLVEVESLAALKRLNDKFLSDRGYKPYLVKGKDTYTGQDVGMLTRIDPEHNMIHRYNEKGQAGQVQKSVSKNYYAKFTVNDTKIAIVSLHFLSRPNAENRKLKREAQADAIRTKSMELVTKGYQVIVLGDFNDYDGDEGYRDHQDNMPITNVLSSIKELCSTTDEDDLINIATMVPKASRYTAFWDKDDDDNIDHPGEYTSIDHLLVSKGLKEKLVYADIPHTFDPRCVTDHFPIVAHFQLGAPTPIAGLRMIRLLPNPVGNENQNEEVVLKNFGSSVINLDGWKLRDKANKHWDLSDALSGGTELTIKRNGQPMAMNNKGDTIQLINPQGVSVQTVKYERVSEQETVEVVINGVY